MTTDLSGNPRRFVVFGVLYNARAYYPVLAILFVDLGLTLDQFVLLNLIWAAAIFLFEVPSGALADTLGRKRLLVAAAVLMIAEMLCLLLAPRHGGMLLFALCVVNRVCSGLSEACASGADEALAYDSLDPDGREDAWDKLLAAAMRWRSAGFVVAMVLGGLLYDPAAVNLLLPEAWAVSPALAHRLPVVLVLGQAIACLGIALRMVEPTRLPTAEAGRSLRHAFALTWQTARWVLFHPRTRVVIVVGLCIDAVTRNFATLTSGYYRLIGLPEWSFGIVGSAIGAMGWFVPGIARSLNNRFGSFANLAIAALLAVTGLAAAAPAWRYFGLLPAALVMTTLGYLSFTVSRALHREADSSRRATVLSVKGLAFNLGYGLFSLAFSRLLAGFPEASPESALKSALLWQLPAITLALVALLAWGHRCWRRAGALNPPA